MTFDPLKAPVSSIVDNEDGTKSVSFGSDEPSEKHESDDSHDENLAEVLEEDILGEIADDLLRDIETDDQSRKEWLGMREQGLGLLGLKVMPPRSSQADGGAPFEGMSTYVDGTLLEACVKFQANARGELLPAEGPVKVSNDGAPILDNDTKADALESAVNGFLTVGSPEYVPDHDRLLFQVGWSGLGVVKGYHCPLRRRPVIESIDAKDIIVSAEATDIDTASRVTQRIVMNHTTFVRMKLAGAYRTIDVAQAESEKTVVDTKLESITGVVKQPQSSRPDRNDRILFECYADLDIPGYEHKDEDGEDSGLPLPYKITLDKSSRKILELRRHWKEGDEQYNKRKTFVAYPFVPAFGFFPLGLMNLIGNATNGITAAFRVAIDNGMINNFPYWLYAKDGAGQDKNDFRAGPGQGIPVNCPTGEKLSDKFMAPPTKSLDSAFVQVMQMVKQDAQRMGGTADIQIGEGKQEAPVGTTIALIEQATKVMDAVHKRLHTAQAEEFRMLRDLLQEDPEALWRYKGKPPYNSEILIQALNDYDLVPQADPNVSSHMMRMTKAEAAKNLVMLGPEQWDLKGTIDYYCTQIGIPEFAKFYKGPPQQQQGAAPDPNAAKAGAQLQVQQLKSQDSAQDRQFKLIELAQRAHVDQQEQQGRMQEKHMDLIKEAVIHPLSQALTADAEQAAQPIPQGLTP